MLLKDLILKLQEEYHNATKDKEYYDMMGEPAVCINSYKSSHCPITGSHFTYTGYNPDIVMYHDVDGTLILDCPQ